MPKIYGPEQPWVDGDITENTIPIRRSGAVDVAGPDGSMQRAVTEGEGVCERGDTSTDVEVNQNKPSEASGGTISSKVGDTPTTEESAGVVNKAVTDQAISEDVEGTVDTKISDDEVTEAELGITDRDVMSDSATQEEAGTINRELGMSSCII